MDCFVASLPCANASRLSQAMTTPIAWRLRCLRVHPAAEAGCLDRNLRPRLRQIESLLDQSCLDLITTADQALVQPVQRPEIIGMLAGAAQLAVETEVGAVYRLGFLDPSLLEQKGSERMAGRLHPSPRLVIGQPVAEFDRSAQMREGGVVLALAIFQLAIQHRLRDFK